MKQNYKNLYSISSCALPKKKGWSLDNIKDGFEYFNELHEHYPTAQEIDNFEYLPSSRSIQRSHGGLVALRKKLDLACILDHTKGKTRSKMAQKTSNRAKYYEEEFFLLLASNFTEMRVHEHKVIRPSDVSCDFFVYTSDNGGIVIDLFYAANLANISKVVNIKYKKYTNSNFKTLFIIVGNDSFLQNDIDLMIKNRKNQLPDFITVITEKEFKRNIYSYISFDT